MTDVFISYARSREGEAERVEEALRALGYGVWRDDQIAAHQAFGEALEERLAAAKVVLVLWSAEAARSEWVRSEASRARAMGKLVQLTLDKSPLPMPFDQIQCANLVGWSGEVAAPGWRKVVSSIEELIGGPTTMVTSAADRAPAAAPALPDKPSIAVLPFANITGGKDEDYFSEGMSEEIVTALSRFPELFVIAGASSLAYRGDTRGQRRIAQELGVRFILDGSVRRSGSRVRIAVKLADAAEGAQVWGERFDGSLEDVFALQDEVATAVAGQIAPSIEAIDIRRAHARPTSDLNAYDLYLRAVHRERDLDRQGLVDTIALLDQALALDPNYARALALAGLMRSVPQLFGLDDLEESCRRALDLARRAMTTGADDPDVLGMVSNILLWCGEDVAAADAIAERALARNPGAAFGWWASAWVKLFDGRPALAMDHWKTHLRLNPRSPFQGHIKGGVGLALVLLGRMDEAIPHLKEAEQLVPNHPFQIVALAVAHARQSLVGEAAHDLRAITPRQISSVLGLLREPAHHELIRSGLALAGADV